MRARSEAPARILEAAIAAKIDRARAYQELGRLRLESALAAPAGRDGKLDDKQLQSILDPLFGARTRPPRMVETYALIADTWAAAATPMEREHFAVIVEGVKFFPRNTGLVMKAALLATARGFVIWHLGFWCRYAPPRTDGSFPVLQQRESWTPRSPRAAPSSSSPRRTPRGWRPSSAAWSPSTPTSPPASSTW